MDNHPSQVLYLPTPFEEHNLLAQKLLQRFAWSNSWPRCPESAMIEECGGRSFQACLPILPWGLGCGSSELTGQFSHKCADGHRRQC